VISFHLILIFSKKEKNNSPHNISAFFSFAQPVFGDFEPFAREHDKSLKDSKRFSFSPSFTRRFLESTRMRLKLKTFKGFTSSANFIQQGGQLSFFKHISVLYRFALCLMIKPLEMTTQA
jgi:hypothetical protein